MVRKLAYIHFVKVAGRYVNYYLQRNVFGNSGEELATQGVKTFNSWIPPFSLARDWADDELLQLASNRHPRQSPTPQEVRIHYQHWEHEYLARQYVHNHHYGWNRDTIRAFRQQGWYTLLFLREPSELLCSLWSWIQQQSQEDIYNGRVIWPISLAQLSLDQFIHAIVTSSGDSGWYALPDYADEVDYVAEFSEENFRNFLKHNFDHDYRPETMEPRHRYGSGNPGFAAYCEQGLISRETQRLLDEDYEVCRVRERLKSSPLNG